MFRLTRQVDAGFVSTDAIEAAELDDDEVRRNSDVSLTIRIVRPTTSVTVARCARQTSPTVETTRHVRRSPLPHDRSHGHACCCARRIEPDMVAADGSAADESAVASIARRVSALLPGAAGAADADDDAEADAAAAAKGAAETKEDPEVRLEMTCRIRISRLVTTPSNCCLTCPLRRRRRRPPPPSPSSAAGARPRSPMAGRSRSGGLGRWFGPAVARGASSADRGGRGRRPDAAPRTLSQRSISRSAGREPVITGARRSTPAPQSGRSADRRRRFNLSSL